MLKSSRIPKSARAHVAVARCVAYFCLGQNSAYLCRGGHASRRQCWRWWLCLRSTCGAASRYVPCCTGRGLRLRRSACRCVPACVSREPPPPHAGSQPEVSQSRDRRYGSVCSRDCAASAAACTMQPLEQRRDTRSLSGRRKRLRCCPRSAKMSRSTRRTRGRVLSVGPAC